MTQCGLCKDCRWFEGNDWGFCRIVVTDNLKRNRPHATLVLYPGAEPYTDEDPVRTYAALRVPANHGCIQFEPKTEEG